METTNNLSDFERKLITIIQHNNKRGKSPSLEELKLRTGHSESNIKDVIDDLVTREWLREIDNKLIVQQNLF